jgi:hypothetical protein
MPPFNRGFDIQCSSLGSSTFRVEVKCSTSAGTQIPLQVRSHLETPLQPDLFYIFVRMSMCEFRTPEFYVMNHEEVRNAWAKMPKVKPDGRPYFIGLTGYIDWKHIYPYKDRWDKLPD